MPKSGHARHSITISAPIDDVYGMIADVSRWPVLFPPTIHATRVEGTDTAERIHIWALAGGQAKSWFSFRELDPGTRTVRFRQEMSPAPVRSMVGTWSLSTRADGATEVSLTHDFSAVDDDPAGMAMIEKAVDRNSTRELAALREVAERNSGPDELEFTFSDEVLINGPAAAAYEFVYRCGEWPRRLPHVSHVDLREDTEGLQFMTMDTRAADGSVHTTESVRVCSPVTKILYKQTRVPPIMTAHVGEWTFKKSRSGTRVTSTHTVALNPDTVTELLGPDATVADARAAVRRALGTNSMTTMKYAKEYAESVGARHASSHLTAEQSR